MGLKKTGLLFYLERIYSVLVGAAFILLVTRNLRPSEFGAWSVVSSVLTYASMATLVNYWVTRFRARGEVESLSTGLALSSAFSLVAMASLAILSRAISDSFDVPYEALVVSVFYLPFLYLNSTMYASLYAVNPPLTAVTEFVFETVKLLAALVFALTSKVTLVTAMLAVLAGHAGQALALAFFTRRDMRHRPSLELAKKVLAYSWVNALGLPASIIALMDVPLISHYASNRAVAYYTVVLTYSNLVGYSYMLGRGLYPSLLQSHENAREKLEETLRFSLLLGVPTALGAVALAPNLLFILNPDYVVAAPVLVAASIASLVGVLNGILSDALQGLEKRDFEGSSPAGLASTYMFKAVVVGLARAVAGITGLVLVLSTVRGDVEIATLARVSWLFAEIMVFASLYALARQHLSLRFVSGVLARYVVASIPMCLVAAYIDPWKVREAFLAVLAGGAVYFTTLYLVDGWFRRLATATLARLARAALRA
ncbi:hypothetical protein IG193_01150 [Infirmifilum lucidum]|uniref:Membrane protein involved in the export of O-antigen and teichoic acid n=1 Tax=Infirmifilum lucidum TaxID=2776706 RepID=A0A7L9FJ99_9CREN|nr:hypothetical protein [Infirmifilum lucidum]QOJ79103.1 hypothetical protein IG193_01150 [Infirmifilum lucidum]